MKIINKWLVQILLLIGVCYPLGTFSVIAKEVEGLFEVSVTIEDQTNSKRRRATSAALNDLIVRISGQSAAAANSVIKARIRNSSAYIQRYGYREEVVINPDGSNGNQLMLDLFFDKISLRKLLRDAGLPLWASNRPQVLTWVAIGNQQQRFLMGTDDAKLLEEIIKDQPAQPELMGEQPIERADGKSGEGIVALAENANPLIKPRELILDKATARGLPVLFPLMDLEDSLAIDVADVWGRFVLPIRRASARYASDAILAVQIVKIEEVWLNRCLLLHRGRTHSWEQEYGSLEEALKASIDITADEIASQYAVLEDSLQRNELLISVTDIEKIDDYAHLMAYLLDLTSIQSVNIARVSASTVELWINLIGEQQAMLQAISLDNRLRRESVPFYNEVTVDGELPSLYFRWNQEYK